jgi:hypothetical protein
MSESVSIEENKKTDVPTGDITNVLENIKALEDSKNELEDHL